MLQTVAVSWLLRHHAALICPMYIDQPLYTPMLLLLLLLQVLVQGYEGVANFSTVVQRADAQV